MHYEFRSVGESLFSPFIHKHTQMKKRVNIYLDAEIVEKAHNLGLNISRIAENALKQAINRINGAYSKKETNSNLNRWWAGPDLNRRSSPREGDVLAS